MESTPNSAKKHFNFHKISWLFSLLVLAILIFFVFYRFSEINQFISLLARVKPQWLIFAAILQIVAYFCAAIVWHLVLKPAGYNLKFKVLIRFSIEKLSINQLIPTGGVAGNVVVLKAMQHLGLPTWLATEALLIDIVTHYLVNGLVAIIAIIFLCYHNLINTVFLTIALLLGIIIIFIPAVLFFFLRSYSWQPPIWLKRSHLLSRLYLLFENLKPERKLSYPIFIKSFLLQVVIFFLHIFTFYFIMQSLDTPISLLTASTAFIAATIAGIITFLPGGLGSFETGSTAVLVLLGTPVEAALIGTLLLHGITIWLVLIPGIWFSRRDLFAYRKIKKD